MLHSVHLLYRLVPVPLGRKLVLMPNLLLSSNAVTECGIPHVVGEQRSVAFRNVRILALLHFCAGKMHTDPTGMAQHAG